MRARIEPGARHVGVHIGGAGGNAERGEIAAHERAEAGALLRLRHVPGHQMIGEIGERIAERGQLPVKHGGDRRRIRRDDDVVETVVAVHQPHRARWRQVRRQPGEQAVHVVDPLCLGRAVLLAPALDLARHVVLAAAEIGQPERRRIVAVEPRQCRVHRLIERRALGRGRLRHVRLPEHAALDMGHHIERRADDGGLLAIEIWMRHRKVLRRQRADQAEFAIDGMRRR